ncbi:MAG TPA: hypothetical protein PLK94_00065 [Alphaproteobacteria bacterium]|nr:hypothetical protein [Alphaproteobacteria bacterium]
MFFDDFFDSMFSGGDSNHDGISDIIEAPVGADADFHHLDSQYNDNGQDVLSVHDAEVYRTVELLNERGFLDIQADLPGFNQPEIVIGPDGDAHIPDVTAVSPEGTLHIIEVETPDSVNTEHAHEQAETFNAAAQREGGVFHILRTDESTST